MDRFDTVVQQRVAFQETEDEFEAPKEGGPVRKNFELLAEEFIKRLGLGELRAKTKKGIASATGGAK